MRVTHVITRLIVGGAQENTIASVLGLREKPGLEVDLVAGPTLGPEGSLESLLADCRPCSPSCLNWSARSTLGRTVWPGRSSPNCFARAGRRLSTPTAAKRASWGGSPPPAPACRSSSTPFTGHPSALFKVRWPTALFRSAERYAARVTTHFVVVAEAMKQQYLAAGIGRPDQYTKNLQRLPAGTVPLRDQRPSTPCPARPRAGRHRHRQDRPSLQAQGARRPAGRRPRARAPVCYTSSSTAASTLSVLCTKWLVSGEVWHNRHNNSS